MKHITLSVLKYSFFIGGIAAMLAPFVWAFQNPANALLLAPLECLAIFFIYAIVQALD